MRPLFWIAVAVTPLLASAASIPPTKPEAHRSPTAVAICPGEHFALAANYHADSVSLVDLREGTVLVELPCGKKPVAVACSPDGRRAAVSNLWSGSISLFERSGSSLVPGGQVKAGALPRGLVFAPDGQSFYAASAGRDEVVRVDWRTRSILSRWPAPREPRHLALSRDGRWLAAASSRSAQVRCWDLRSGSLYWERTIEDAFNLRGLMFSPDGRFMVCAHTVRRSFPVSRENIDKGWVIDSRLTRLAVDKDALPNSWQIALDTHGEAVGDPDGMTFLDGGRTLIVSAGGTHELLVFTAAGLPWNAGDPGDFIDPELRKRGHFHRIPVSGRPLAVTPLGRDHVVVANYLADCLQIVDVNKRAVSRTVPLGGPTRRSLAREGEAIFYDARRSHNQWFSCHTCHVDGYTCGLTFDTLNDDSYGTPKLTPSLFNVTKTGPWTWHGWQKDLGAGVMKSLTQTMFGPVPTKREVAALLAYLGTLEPPPNPQPVTPAVHRGKELFHAKAGCSRCHRPPYFTSSGVYDVKLEPDGSPYKLWNPPSLTGLYNRGPYLHDGRAKSLQDLLQTYHTPEMVGGEALSATERADLIAFLLSL